mmetsp:Transcript_10002/g.24941  ORF Transcript_10002/g.24941 Transcript_10002/m.24941 type:complete len:337 (+) Transcript_10002:65-1075(+)
MGSSASSGADSGFRADSEDIHTQALTFTLETDGVRIRRIEKEDVPVAADICQRAFHAFQASIGLGPEFPPQEIDDVPSFLLGQAFSEGFVGFVAESKAEGGGILGSNLVELRDGVAGIGPITVDPECQVKGVGRLLMKAVMKEAAQEGIRSVRLVQVAANTRSFSLYVSLGFNPSTTCGQYEATSHLKLEPPSGFTCKPLTSELVEPCSQLHFSTCGSQRAKDIAAVVGSKHPNCAVFDDSGSLAAYTTGSFLAGHTVAKSMEAFQALVAFQSQAVQTAQSQGVVLPPASFFVPHAYPQLVRWLLRSGFRLNRQVVPMSYGPHTPPCPFYCPAIQY